MACNEMEVSDTGSSNLKTETVSLEAAPGLSVNGKAPIIPENSNYLLSTMAANNASVTISSGMTVIIDKSVNVNFIRIRPGGKLICDAAVADPNIVIRTLFIEVEGEFECGTALNRYHKKLSISLKHNPTLNPRLPNVKNYRSIHVMGGKLSLHGSLNKSSWGHIAGTLNAGSNTVTVMKQTDPNNFFNRGWERGDKIVIGPTGFDAEEAEEFTIQRVDTTTYTNRIIYTLDRNADYQHWGDVETLNSQSMGQVILNERAEIANLNRNIRILPDEMYGSNVETMQAPYDQVGGHIMIMNATRNGQLHVGKAYIDSVELKRMGQAGIMARYPFHWHLSRDVHGQYIQNTSIHESFSRCVTVHQTNHALVKNNVCYNFKGHGYFLEDGNEIKNRIIRNLAIMSQFPDTDKLLLSSDDKRQAYNPNSGLYNGPFIGGSQYGRFHPVSSFWISNPDNDVSWNVASGSVGTGFWNAFKDRFDGLGGTVYPNKARTLKFWHNTAHASIIGMTWDGAEKYNGPYSQPIIRANNPESRLITNSHYRPAGNQVPVFKGLRVFKNRLTGIYFRSNTNIIENLIAVDNGWALWNAFNNIVKDSIIVGRSNNTNSQMYSKLTGGQGLKHRRLNFHAGVIVYDGPFEVHNTDFINFTTSSIEAGELSGGNYTPYNIPIMSIGGARKFVNYTSGLNFSPEPYHRAYLFDQDTDIQVTAGHKLPQLHNGESMIRDLDGTLIGNNNGGYITGIGSLGIKNSMGCQDGSERLHNYYVCASSVKENIISVQRIGNGGSGQQPINPYLVRRQSDGALSLPKDLWQNVIDEKYRNLKFNASRDPMDVYHMLTQKQYKQLKNGGHHLELGIASELNGTHPEFETAIIRINEFGSNCRLDEAAQKNGLNHLRQSEQTAYYSQGNNLFVKLVPNAKFKDMNNTPVSRATTFLNYRPDNQGNLTRGRHRVICDDSMIPSYVKGRIDNVIYESTVTRIKGWACNVRSETPPKVQVQLKGLPLGSAPINLTGQLNLTGDAEEAINFTCASMGLETARFDIPIQNTMLAPYPTHKIHVLGISTVGGSSGYISRSGTYSAVQNSYKK